MRTLYEYKGQDITMDIVMKTEDVVHKISMIEKLPFDQCIEMFTATRAYRNLQNTATLMWAESAEYIVDEYYREIRNPNP